MPAFYNHATLTYGNTTIDSNTVQGELTVALRMEKRAVHDRYRPGDMIAYAVTLTNSGATDSEELQLVDDLGAGGEGSRAPLEYVRGSAKYYVNGELQPEPTAEVGAALTVRGLRVPANGDAALLYAVRVNDFAPMGEGAVVTNTARLEAAGQNSPMLRAAPAPGQGDTPSLPIFASADIFPEEGARLSIGKSLHPSTVAPGEPLTYTLTIENAGSTPVLAGDGAAVSDRFDPLLDIRGVRYNGADWSEPANYSYDRATGMFATAAGQLSVPAATFSQDAVTGRWQVTPGVSTIEITGTLK